MSGFWTRTRTFLVLVWSATIAAELVAIKLVERTDSSWVLLLFLGILVVPLVATDMTVRWVKRPVRERWARHDVSAELASARRIVVEAPTDSASQAPPSAAL